MLPVFVFKLWDSILKAWNISSYLKCLCCTTSRTVGVIESSPFQAQILWSLDFIAYYCILEKRQEDFQVLQWVLCDTILIFTHTAGWLFEKIKPCAKELVFTDWIAYAHWETWFLGISYKCIQNSEFLSLWPWVNELECRHREDF